MQIVIPMSGVGERFRKAGYTLPKPLIRVDHKPIIAHVIDLFPGETDFLFICNREHLDETTYAMSETLRRYAPGGRIVGISPHKKGPIWAVLQSRDLIDPNRPMILNYCDFSCYWDWTDFKSFVQETGCAGAIPAYRGFHPHSLGSTRYAYLRERHGWVTDIQEKQPFTDNPMNEFASSGTYYFDSGARCIDAFDEVVANDLNVGGEYYASLAYKGLAKRRTPIAVYELQHFMQWGTPEDLETYAGWSNAFRRLAVDDDRRARQPGTTLVPMAGHGKRFVDAGYELPKPLITVSGRPMVIQATRDLPDAPATRFVLRNDVPHLKEILLKLRTSFVGVSSVVLEHATEGQAITCNLAMDGLDLSAPLSIGACDNAMIYDPEAFERHMAPGGPDVLVWVVRGHADGRRRPEMFGWVDADAEGRIRKVLVKEAPADPATCPLIVGAFTFRRAADYQRACERLVERNGRVNGEFYVDSLIADAVEMGLDCRIFEIEHYLGWGTPHDLQTFEYWQSCFHKWKAHPYSIFQDRRVPSSATADLARRYESIRPSRPKSSGSTMAGAARNDIQDRLIGEGKRFIPVGVTAVAIDLLVYAGMIRADLDPSVSKLVSFLAGALFAFIGNRYYTFRRQSGSYGFVLFWFVYATSLVLNVTVNVGLLAIFKGFATPSWLPLGFAFVAATGVSAASNFIGMRTLVFRGKEDPKDMTEHRNQKVSFGSAKRPFGVKWSEIALAITIVVFVACYWYFSNNPPALTMRRV